MRIGHEEVAANPDGIDLSGPMIEAGMLAGQINREELADMQSSAFKIGFDQMIATDLAYANSRSVLLDMLIIRLTLRAVLTGRGAY